MNFKEELEKQNAEYVDAWFKKKCGHRTFKSDVA